MTDGLGGGAGVWPGSRGTLKGSAAPPAPPGSIGTLNPSVDGGGKLGTLKLNTFIFLFQCIFLNVGILF